jgi:hypothetical protein
MRYALKSLLFLGIIAGFYASQSVEGAVRLMPKMPLDTSDVLPSGGIPSQGPLFFYDPTLHDDQKKYDKISCRGAIQGRICETALS